MAISIALVGDPNDAVLAHRCIPRALELAGQAEKCSVTPAWIQTEEVAAGPERVRDFDAIWLVPASPYASFNGALHVVRYARERGRPFLGTCGGFQHAILEFARNVAHLTEADHAETNAEAKVPVVSLLSCGLVEVGGEVALVPGSRLQCACGASRLHEEYHCRYGVNSAYQSLLEKAGLRFTAFDLAGDIRGGELPGHPFFVGTLFQPERSARQEQVHPLIAAFVRAARERKQD